MNFMRQETDAQVLRVYIGEDDHWHSGLLYPAIVEKLKEAGIAGVTVMRGIEGFGSHSRLHTARIDALFQGLPMVIEAVDIPERIAAALALLDEMLVEGTVTVQDVKAIHYMKEPGQNSGA